MKIKRYDRAAAVGYAQKWALGRNPKYYNFDSYELGGDCTNFVSQCLFAGCGVMNFTKTFGWYYVSLNNRSPAWSGVKQLHNFLVVNKGAGPFGRVMPISAAKEGDIVQLSFDGINFSHSLIVSKIQKDGQILVCCHTYDSLDRPLSSYSYLDLRLIEIEGFRG